VKKRSVVTVYLLTFLTGIYFFFWMYYIMRDLNVISGKTVFDMKKKLTSLLSVFIPFIIIFCIPLIGGGENPTFEQYIRIAVLFIIVFLLAIHWLRIIISILWQVSERIATIETDNRLEKPITKGKTIFLLFLYLTAIPYIQYHMNRIVDIYNQNKLILKIGL
jgi:hypothetical protein